MEIPSRRGGEGGGYVTDSKQAAGLIVSNSTQRDTAPPDASEAGRPARPAQRRTGLRLMVAGLGVFAVLSLFVVYTLTYRAELAALRRDAKITAELQAAVLQRELEKQRSAPVILASDRDVIDALQDPAAARLHEISQKLAKLQAETKSAAIYLIDRRGDALAASNYALPSSFVGSNYSFRRYFSEALRLGQAEQFALGTVSRHPGLYIAHRVEAAGRPIGVIVVKVEFDPIEEEWGGGASRTYVADTAGAVLLTNVAGARFHALPKLRADEMLTTVPAPAAGWRLNLVTSLTPAQRAARSATLMGAMAESLLLALVAWLWRRRVLIAERAAAEAEYRERLERDVERRTHELREANRRLSEEIRERRQTERRLNVLQADLVQANKLAHLGQITAGVAHEINQPLAAIRILAESAQLMVKTQGAKAVDDAIQGNFADIVRMSERIAHITGELRAFSRKSTGASEPVPLKETIESSILLNGSRQRENEVRIVCEGVGPNLRVIAQKVRLEQVLVNLLQNAYEALEDTIDPEIRISLDTDKDWVRLRISDNGPGLQPQVLSQLFTPFVTTKSTGLGLGLVIAHDILRDFGGELAAENGPSGAVFTAKLRRAAA
jgi:two-component system C4-dicarboxylate transport sensor histidine kinase DctB